MKIKDKSEERYQRKLIDLDRRIIELEKLEIARQKAEMRLRKIEETYSNFFAQSRDPIVLIQDRVVKHIAPCVPRILGYTKEQLVNTSFGVHVNPDELPRLVNYWVQRIAGKDAPPIYKTVLKHRDGQNVHVEIRAGIVTYQGMPADFAIVKQLAEIPQESRMRVRPAGSRV